MFVVATALRPRSSTLIARARVLLIPGLRRLHFYAQLPLRPPVRRTLELRVRLTLTRVKRPST